MAGAERLRQAFERGELLRPSAEVPNLVDLARVIAAACGVEVPLTTRGARMLRDVVGEPRHLVLLLVDGFGLRMLEQRPGGSVLRRLLAMELRTVFPSTTASAVTSLATGEWPAQHAVVGWWTHLPALDAAATVLPFQRRSDERPLEELGIGVEQAFPVAPLLARATRETLSLLPQSIVDSTYSRYMSAGGERLGYRTLREAAATLLERVQRARGPTFTYLYTPRVDAVAHDLGTSRPELWAEVAQIEEIVESIALGLGADSRLVVTADHGHLEAPIGLRHQLRNGSVLAAEQRIPPSGDPRSIYFHLREGARERFREHFDARFADEFALITIDELEELELLGPGPLSDETRRRVGDLVAISLGPSVLGMPGITGGEKSLSLASHHSGLTPAEMRIPLVVA